MTVRKFLLADHIHTDGAKTAKDFPYRYISGPVQRGVDNMQRAGGFFYTQA